MTTAENLCGMTTVAMNLFFSDADLFENFKFFENCPYDFDEISHVASNDKWASGHTKLLPEVTAPKGVSLTFLHFSSVELFCENFL